MNNLEENKIVQLYSAVRGLLLSARQKAYSAVNFAMVQYLGRTAFPTPHYKYGVIAFGCCPYGALSTLSTYLPEAKEVCPFSHRKCSSPLSFPFIFFWISPKNHYLSARKEKRFALCLNL